jgi:hypothetical protein
MNISIYTTTSFLLTENKDQSLYCLAASDQILIDFLTFCVTLDKNGIMCS